MVEDDDAAIALSRPVCAGAPGGSDGPRRLLSSQHCETTAACSSARKAPSPTATRGSAPNHTLPTGRAARYTGGLWVGKFLKTVTYQRLTQEASERIAPIIGRMCPTEGMLAHEITAKVRAQRYAQRVRQRTAA